MHSSAAQPLIILNPVSGKGDPAKRRHDVALAAARLGWQGTLIETAPERTAFAIATSAVADGCKHIIVCGGDGSIMEVLPAIAYRDVVLGIVPLGTGNIFALNLKIPTRLSAALALALSGTARRIDIGTANNRHFGVIAGIGWDAALLRDATRELKDRLGPVAYFISAIRNLAHSPGRYLIGLDGEKPREYRAKCIMIANMGKIQGGFKAIPHAHPHSGKLTVGVMQPDSLGSWLSLLWDGLAGHIDRNTNYTVLEASSIRIRSLSGPQPIECDGTVFGPSRQLNLEVLKGAVLVMAPSTE